MKRTSILGAIVILALFLVALFAPFIAPYSYAELSICEALAKPHQGHWLGQDKLGRDILSELIFGARVSIVVAFSVVTISAFIGFIIGAMSGLLGGIIDQIVMRIIDLLMAFPGILLAIALTAVLGPGLKNVIFALTALGWVGYARMVRSQVLVEREKLYLESARAVGANKIQIIFRHLLPNVIGVLLVQASFGAGYAILAEASLSFLGLGTIELPSWGAMLNHGISFLRVAPHLVMFPGIAIMFSVLGFNLLGDGLSDYFRGGNTKHL